MVAGRGEGLEWYDGPTLLEVLEELPVGHERPESFRFPVQWVCRPQASSDPALHDYRGFIGRVESGSIAVGDEVEVLPSGRVSRVKDVQLGGISIGRAEADQSVAILLEDEIDVSRGDLLVRAGEAPLGRRGRSTRWCAGYRRRRSFDLGSTWSGTPRGRCALRSSPSTTAWR